MGIKFEWDPDKAVEGFQKHEGVAGKYALRHEEGTHLVLLAPDVADAFPDEEAVNDALQIVMQLADIPKKTTEQRAFSSSTS